MTLELKSLLVPSKATEVELPGFPDFKIKVSFLSRELLLKIRKKCTKTTYKNRQPSEEFDDELFLKLYVEEAIKGWSGLKFAYVEQLLPVDVSAQNPEDELEYSHENALTLMKNSGTFDSYISEVVSDLGNFIKDSKS